MKKNLLATAVILSMLAALTGCTGNNNSSDTSDTSSDNANSSAVTSEAQGPITSEAGNGEDLAGADSTVENGTIGATTENGTTDIGAGDIPEEEYTEYTPDPDGRAAKLAAAAFSGTEFPAMMEVTRSDWAEGFFGIDLSICEDFYISNAMISAQLNEVIIAKPKAGSEEALKAQFDSHFDYIKNDPNATFYPAQEASAEGAVSGETADGYYYIIVHENGESAAEALLAAE